MFRVQADRLDDEVEFVGAVELARYAIGRVGPDELGLGKVIEPVNPLRIAVPHEEHGIRRIFRPRDEDEMIGAEVKHGREGGGAEGPTRLGSAVVGLARRTPPAGLRSQRGASSKPARIPQPADGDSCWACASCRCPAGRSRSLDILVSGAHTHIKNLWEDHKSPG